MSVVDIIRSKPRTFSIEMFPPKDPKNLSKFLDKVDRMQDLGTAYMTCTFGAMGGSMDTTFDMVRYMNENGIGVAHLAGVNITKEEAEEYIKKCAYYGIHDYMALRGDIIEQRGYNSSLELMENIRRLDTEACIGGGCYPEGYPDRSFADSTFMASFKTCAGFDYLVTQMFFDNSRFYSFKVAVGNQFSFIDVPGTIVPAIMPVTSYEGLEKSIGVSKVHMPDWAVGGYKCHSKEFQRVFGLDKTIEQILDLYSHGEKHVHIYSMNNVENMEYIINSIKEVL